MRLLALRTYNNNFPKILISRTHANIFTTTPIMRGAIKEEEEEENLNVFVCGIFGYNSVRFFIYLRTNRCKILKKNMINYFFRNKMVTI